MKRLIPASILLALVATAVILSPPSAIASSCRDDCRSYCCTDSRCTKDNESKCYSDCAWDCDHPAPQPKKDKSTLPPT
jgi:hypothetical protein